MPRKVPDNVDPQWAVVEEQTGTIYDLCGAVLALLEGRKDSGSKAACYLMREVVKINTQLHDSAYMEIEGNAS